MNRMGHGVSILIILIILYRMDHGVSILIILLILVLAGKI